MPKNIKLINVSPPWTSYVRTVKVKYVRISPLDSRLWYYGICLKYLSWNHFNQRWQMGVQTAKVLSVVHILKHAKRWLWNVWIELWRWISKTPNISSDLCHREKSLNSWYKESTNHCLQIWVNSFDNLTMNANPVIDATAAANRKALVFGWKSPKPRVDILSPAK